MQNTLTGDYDLYLYKYEADGTLTLVSYSESTNEDEHISYVGDASDTGYYWLFVNPYTPAEPSETYTLRVDTLNTFDSHEPNDNFNFSSEYVGTINTSATIDNPHDVDTYSLEVTTAGRYVINLSNVQTGDSYAVDIYDKNFNYFGYFVSTGENEAYVTANANETYYFKVRSYDGTYNNNIHYSYKLKVMELHGNGLIATPNGQHIDITAQDIYIDGTKVSLNWDYEYHINYTRTEELTKDSDYYINLLPSLYHREGFANGAETESNNAIISIPLKRKSCV